MKLFGNIINKVANLRNGLVSSSAFQSVAGGIPIVRNFARKDGEKIYDIVAGFVYSQTLLAMVELNMFSKLKDGYLSLDALADSSNISVDKMRILCQSATAIGLLTRIDVSHYRLSRLGAIIVGVPGLEDMIRHHRLFYQDLADPVGLMRNEIDTHMSKYWPYVHGKMEEGQSSYANARIYSDLMRTSQKLVAEETLRFVSFSGVKHLMDVGGGTGSFLNEVYKQYPNIELTLFDLPNVIAESKNIVFVDNSRTNLNFQSGNFVTDSLPTGADAVSLVRVLYDHNDDLVTKLLEKVYSCLPSRGLIVISEPMSGGQKASRSGDSYFGFYTMAMTSGRPRDPKTHLNFLSGAGFKDLKTYKGSKGFITGIVTGRKP